MSARVFYDKLPQYNDRLARGIAGLTAEQLASRPAPDLLPIWAIAGHTAAMRVYWLCTICREPGAETTPFTDHEGEDWADHLDHPRTADELVGALRTTFAVVDGVLDRWTPEMLAEEVERRYANVVQRHTRSSILQRLLTHEAWHSAEVSQLLGIHGLPQIDLWAEEPRLGS